LSEKNCVYYTSSMNAAVNVKYINVRTVTERFSVKGTQKVEFYRE
jgi:hypothetical protein